MYTSVCPTLGVYAPVVSISVRVSVVISYCETSTLPSGLTRRNLPAERLVMSTSSNVMKVFANAIQVVPKLVL